ncbi:MAG: hypothetical protein WDM79_08965 [Terricaulis sp.]
MGAIGRILLIVVVVVLIAAGAAYFVLPSSASRTESFTIARPPASVFARLASAPPGTQIAEGVTQTAISSAADNVVVAEVAYADGATGRATYTVTPEGAGSRVDIKLEQALGSNPLNRVQALTGGNVGPLAEAAAATVTADLNAVPAANFAGLAYSIEQVAARPFFYVSNCSPQDPEAIKEVVTQSLIVLRPLMARYNLQVAGDPVAVETSWENEQYCFQIGLPYTGTPPRVLAVGTAGQTPAGVAVRVPYTGSEEQVIPVYDQMEALIASARLVRGKSFEIYHDDATQVGGSINREIFYLVEGDTAQLTRLAPPAALPTPAPAPAAPAAAAPAATPAPGTPAPAATPAPATPAPATTPTPAPATTP